MRALIIQGQREITEFHKSNRQNNYLRLNFVALVREIVLSSRGWITKRKKSFRSYWIMWTGRPTGLGCLANMSASNPPGKVDFCDVSYDTVAMMKLQSVSFRGWLNLSLNKIKGQKYHWLVTVFLSWIHPFSFANRLCI